MYTREEIEQALEEQEERERRKAEYEERQENLRIFAEKEGAWYYDPNSPTIWKRYIIGHVPLWRRILWVIFPPSHQKVRRIMQRQTDRMWKL